MKQNMQDLTEGPLGKKILIFSVPLMLSNLLQVLFIIGAAIVFGIQVAKSVYDKKQLAKAEEKIEEE